MKDGMSCTATLGTRVVDAFSFFFKCNFDSWKYSVHFWWSFRKVKDFSKILAPT